MTGTPLRARSSLLTTGSAWPAGCWSCAGQGRAAATSDRRRRLQAAFDDIDQIVVGHILLLIGQRDEARIGLLQLLSIQAVAELAQTSIETVAPGVLAEHQACIIPADRLWRH